MAVFVDQLVIHRAVPPVEFGHTLVRVENTAFQVAKLPW